ncbi:hypothetical protein K492DRAFT_234049 [Lichtheimia hyalospora FSU 10163]|nr:hypothetical protein K492DRAFT_234049 [Lichtheimia hyalospora FSU 10163]
MHHFNKYKGTDHQVRDPQQQLGKVKFMHILCDPDEIDDPSSKERPLLALVCDIHHHDTITSSEQHNQNTTILRFYSLHTQEFVREFQHVGDENSCIKSIQSNSRYIVLGCISNNPTTKGLPTGTLHILWNSTLEQACSPFTDVACYQSSGPVYALGSRYLAYATTTEVSLKEDRSGNFLVHMTDKDMMKEAARGIAKEVVSGVRSLGEYGYQSLSNYFNQQESPPIDMAFQQQHRRAATTGSMSTGSLDGASTTASSSSKQQQLLPSGMIMIRDLPNDKPSHQGSIVAHFRPHTHPVTILTFNPSGTLLLSASSQGHTFHVYSLMDNKVIYKLSRGITDAQVTDARFTTDSLWCAVTTTKGTTHLYAINPYGGQPEIHGHAQSKVLNPKNHILTTLDGWKHVSPVSLSPMVRIKQRHPMQSKNNDSNRHVPLNSLDNRSSTTTTIPYSNTGVEPPITPPPFLSALSSTPYLNDDSVRLATLFLPVTKIPYHHDQKQQEGSSSPYSSSGLPWLKNQANQLGHMLPTGMMDAAVGRRRWSDDARIFGFDEEQQQEEEDRPLAVAHRDLLSVHPDGILTLHRCCMTETLVQTREHGRAVERLELITKESDVAEWHVARYPNWNQVKEPMDKASSSSITVSKHGWLSCAEIATYDNSSLEQPIWMTPGFSMHVFTGGTIEEQLNQGTVPQTQALDFKRDMPEPYNIRVNRVGKTSVAVASKEGRVEDEALDNALNELKDNLSSAMKTSFSPSTPTQYLGTSPIMRLSSSADAQSVDRESPLSFEDAQLISLGAEDVTYSPQRTRHNDINESEEVIFFSPDGDNEIASPHDSIADDQPNKPDDDNEIPSHDSITSNEPSHNDNISS